MKKKKAETDTFKGLVGYKAILPKPLCNLEFLPALEKKNT